MYQVSAAGKEKRSEIARIVRSIVPSLKGHMYCDPRTSEHPGNLYGHSMKWAHARLSDAQINAVNKALEKHNVVIRNTSAPETKLNRRYHTYAGVGVQVFHK